MYSTRLQITATDVAWSVCLCVSVVWATTVIPAKMAELIEMLSGCELVEPKEPCLRLGPASPTGGALWGGDRPMGVTTVDILNIIRKGQHAAMQPIATVNVATCYT